MITVRKARKDVIWCNANTGDHVDNDDGEQHYEIEFHHNSFQSTIVVLCEGCLNEFVAKATEQLKTE